MADLNPDSKLLPQALVIQLDPETCGVMEMALRFCVEMPSGQVLHEQELWWKDATPGQRKIARMLAHAAIHACAGDREVQKPPSWEGAKNDPVLMKDIADLQGMK